MAAYATAWLSDDSPLAADAVTLSPYLGFESLRPALDLARATGRGTFVLALTSNPEGASVQHVGGEDSVAAGILSAVAHENRAPGARGPAASSSAQASGQGPARHTDDRDQIVTSAGTGGLGSCGVVIGATVGEAMGRSGSTSGAERAGPRAGIRCAGSGRGRRRLGVLPGQGHGAGQLVP